MRVYVPTAGIQKFDPQSLQVRLEFFLRGSVPICFVLRSERTIYAGADPKGARGDFGNLFHRQHYYSNTTIINNINIMFSIFI